MGSNDLISAWSSSLWNASWQGLLFVALVWAVCLAFRSLPASVKAWLWWLAALKLLIGLLWVGIEVPVLPPPSVSPLAQFNRRLDLMAPKAPAVATPTAAGTTTSSGPVTSTNRRDTNWLPIGLIVLWSAGFVIVVGSVAVQSFKLAGLRRRAHPAGASLSGEIARSLGAQMGLSRRPTLLRSSEITSPMVVGLFAPALMIPEGLEASLTDDELKLCIAHELAHIKRLDLPLALIPALVQALYFFFPPAWLARREWEIEREAACDAAAITFTNASPAAYGQLLIKIVTADHRGGLVPALGATASYHTLKKRITNMKHFAPTSRRLRLGATAIAGLALLLALPWRISARADSVPPREEKNLVVNGGFEEGSGSQIVGWARGSLPPDTEVPVTISINRIRDDDSADVKAVVHKGRGSVSFAKTESRFFPVAMLTQELPYNGEKAIKVGMWAKAQGVHKFTMAVIMQGGDGKIEWGAYIGDSTGRQAIDHDWKQYSKIVNIPSGTTNVILALEMYGPGTVYVDDVSASYTDGTGGSRTTTDDSEALADVKDVSNEDLHAGGDPMMHYFLIGAKGPEPAGGYKLLIVMPGGDGSADFNPFIRRIWQNALPGGYAIAELVAPKWSDEQFSTIVWPTRKQRWQGMQFATEDFIAKVIQEVGKKHKVDAAHVYTMSWSSSGPAAYAASLDLNSIKGSFVAMSIFKPSELPALFNAKGQAYYIYHSPDDSMIPLSHPQLAEQELRKAGAKTILETYAGGHGWHGDIYGGIRKGMEWLEKNSE